MEGAHEIMQGLLDIEECEISVLVPNLKGFELAKRCRRKDYYSSALSYRNNEPKKYQYEP